MGGMFKYFKTLNIALTYIPDAQKNRTKLLKSSQVLETMDPDDNNVYASNILGKYEYRPDNLEQLFLADFAFMYEYAWNSEEEQKGTEDIKSYTKSVSHFHENYGKKRKLFNSKMD